MQTGSTKQLQDQAREAEKARTKLASGVEAEKATGHKMEHEHENQLKHLQDQSAKSLI